jgi:hypothetical protein
MLNAALSCFQGMSYQTANIRMSSGRNFPFVSDLRFRLGFSAIERLRIVDASPV